MRFFAHLVRAGLLIAALLHHFIPTSSSYAHPATAPHAIVAGQQEYIQVEDDGSFRLLPNAPPAPAVYGNYKRFGLAISPAQSLSAPFRTIRIDYTANVPPGAAVHIDMRASADGLRWSGWEIDLTSGANATFATPARFAQYRVILLGSAGAGPVVQDVRLAPQGQPTYTAQTEVVPPIAPTYRIRATRMGMIGGRTANGHRITPRDHFVSLPSRRSLSSRGGSEYQVRITYKGRSSVAPVYDVGPWNINDNYWDEQRDRFKDLARGWPEDHAAYYDGYNNGMAEKGRVRFPTAIDVGDGVWWDDLGIRGDQAEVEVTFLWLGSDPLASPPPAPVPAPVEPAPVEPAPAPAPVEPAPVEPAPVPAPVEPAPVEPAPAPAEPAPAPVEPAPVPVEPAPAPAPVEPAPAAPPPALVEPAPVEPMPAAPAPTPEPSVSPPPAAPAPVEPAPVEPAPVETAPPPAPAEPTPAPVEPAPAAPAPVEPAPVETAPAPAPADPTLAPVEPALPAPAPVEPAPLPAPAPPAEIVVDERDPAFKPERATWYDSPDGCGGAGHAFWTYTTPDRNASENVARWQPALPAEETYDVYVHIPACKGKRANTESARYFVHHRDGVQEVVINQGATSEWVHLGRFPFAAGEGGFVELRDVTGDSMRVLWYDAVKWVPAL